jgi:hypothetical protein
MISIFLLYSNDRINEAKIAIECLNDSKEFASCHKILCCDGKTNFKPNDFQTIEVERPESGFYCWANMWEAAINVAKYEKILYLDSDRILPINGLKQLVDAIDDDCFVFPKKLFSIKEKCDLKMIRNVRDDILSYQNLLLADHRVCTSAWAAVRKKNPMSGCVGFTKSGFLKSGGLDKSFQGWGYPDTDFFEKTYRMGFAFKGLEIEELHLHHNYEVKLREFKLMNLWNGVKFCKKWGFEIHPELKIVAEELQISISILSKYKQLSQFLKISKKGIKMV